MNSSVSRLLAPALLELKISPQDDKRIESLLPDALWWFYIVGPPLIVSMIHPQLLVRDFGTAWRALVTTYIHAAAVAAPLHFAYARLLPRAFALLPERSWIRNALHFGTVLVLVPLATLAIKPLIEPFCPAPMNVQEALVHAYVISTLMLLSAVTYQRLRRRAKEVERLAAAERQAALTAQLRALQARTNPHFLFNSLNAVASLIPTHPERAEEMLERLADVLRYSLQRTRRSTVRLEDELEVVEEYLEIESARFGDRLSYRIEIDPRTKRLRIPPMALEPLVENAVLHGIGSKREGGTLVIEARIAGEDLRLSVTDDGPGCGGSAYAGTGTGLDDLRERLLLLYGRDDLLHLGRGPDGGCCATLVLPVSKR